MRQDAETEAFAETLRTLCQQRRSISAVARAIGVNRQQFQKYINGQTFPSPNMRLRIARHFGVPMEDFLNPDTLPKLSQSAYQPEDETRWGEKAWDGELNRLRQYSGIYHVHFITPAFADFVHVGVCNIREQNDAMQTAFFIRSRDPKTGLLHRSHLVGTLNLRSERLFIVERSKKARDRFSQTILLPTHGDRMRYLNGISLGLTWHPASRPYASRTIWRRARTSSSLRDAIRTCGLFPIRSPSIDAQVRNFFLSVGSDLSENLLAV
ncbi:MAG: helix-turn-helix transcriptional regulator [Pseudomonadota bacterium]